MIHPRLHRQPVPVDRERHRHAKLDMPVRDWSFTAELNSLFVTAVEVADLSREYPIVFVRMPEESDGKPEIAPIAVFGLDKAQNLYLDGTQWRTRLLPSLLQVYPLCIGRVDAQRYAICVDSAWPGLNEQQGQALFNEDGTATPTLEAAQKRMERLEAEVQRTRAVCRRLRDLDVMREGGFEVTLPDGNKHRIDGFLTVDEKRMRELPDATVAELHRDGVLGMVYAHWFSLANIRHLAEWMDQRRAAQPASAPAA